MDSGNAETKDKGLSGAGGTGSDPGPQWVSTSELERLSGGELDLRHPHCGLGEVPGRLCLRPEQLCGHAGQGGGREFLGGLHGQQAPGSQHQPGGPSGHGPMWSRLGSVLLPFCPAAPAGVVPVPLQDRVTGGTFSLCSAVLTPGRGLPSRACEPRSQAQLSPIPSPSLCVFEEGPWTSLEGSQQFVSLGRYHEGTVFQVDPQSLRVRECGLSPRTELQPASGVPDARKRGLSCGEPVTPSLSPWGPPSFLSSPDTLSQRTGEGGGVGPA